MARIGRNFGICFSKLLVAVAIFSACFSVGEVRAQTTDYKTATSTCQPNKSGNQKGAAYTTNCPAVKGRNDIDPSCIEILNKAACLNTMPAGGITTVPEDVCRRVGDSKNHRGMDYAAAVGTPITAAADGTVQRNSCMTGGGRAVIMTHKGCNGDYKTWYLHLSAYDKYAPSGKFVKKGTVIGYVGGSSCGTGGLIEKAYGYHLHFEIRTMRDETLDPMCSNIQGLCCGKAASTAGCRKNCKDPNVQCGTSTGGGPAGGGADASGGTDAGGAQSGGQTCDLQSYMSAYSDCIFCNLFKVLFNTASEIAKKAFNTFAGAVQIVVLVGMAMWIAYTLIKTLSSLEIKEPRAMLQGILNQAFIVLAVFLLLSMDPQKFLGLFMEPIFNTGLKLSSLIVGGVECTNTFGILENGGLPASMGINILCSIKNTQDAILKVISMGSFAMCLGFHEFSWKHIPLFPHMGFVLVGLLLWICGVFMLVIYPFLLVDAVLQLCVASALLPAAIGCYAFKVTRAYVKKVFETFMTAMFAFLFLSIILFLIMTQIESVTDEMLGLVGTKRGGAIDLVLDAEVRAGLLKRLAWSATAPLKMVFILFLGWAVLGVANKFAKDFAGGLQLAVGRETGGLAVNTANKIGKKAMKPIAKAAKSVARGAAATAKENYHGIKNKIHGGLIKNNKNAVDNGDGTHTLQTRNMFGRKVTKTLSYGDDGRAIIKRETKMGNKVRVMVNDGYIKSEEFTYKDGSKKTKTSMLTAGGQYLINKDGSMNQIAMNAIMNGSDQSKDVVQTAILNQLMKERMPGIELASTEGRYKSRQLVRSVDAEGREVFAIEQENADGSKTVFSMTKSLDGKRMMTAIENTSKDGKKKLRYMSDGIINAREEEKLDTNGNFKITDADYAFTGYYSKYSDQPMDSTGRIKGHIPEGEIMHDTNAMNRVKKQFYDIGTNANLHGFK